MEFTREYFIEKFEAIPDNLWTIVYLTSELNSKCHCALGHCGVKLNDDDENEYTDEAWALSNILSSYHEMAFGFSADPSVLTHNNVWRINDDNLNRHLTGKTPKERILNALRDIV